MHQKEKTVNTFLHFFVSDYSDADMKDCHLGENIISFSLAKL